MIDYRDYYDYDYLWWKDEDIKYKEAGDKNKEEEKSPVEEKESIKEEKKEETSTSIDTRSPLRKALESDENPYKESTIKLPSGKTVVKAHPIDKKVKDKYTFDAELLSNRDTLFYDQSEIKKMWENLYPKPVEKSPKTLDEIDSDIEESKEKVKNTDYMLGVKKSDYYPKSKTLDEIVEESKEKVKVKKTDYIDYGYTKWSSNGLSSQAIKKSYSSKESYSDIIKEKEDEIDSLWLKLRTAEKKKTSLQIDNSKLMSEYQKTMQEKTSLEKENKMLKDKLFLIEKNPDEYKRRREVDPFDEENWEENDT